MPRTKKIRRPKKGTRETGPTLRLRRTSSGSLVTYAKFNGAFFSFGLAEDPQSRVRFAEAKAHWEANGRKRIEPTVEAPPITVDALCDRYVKHATTYYRHPDGSATGHATAVA